MTLAPEDANSKLVEVVTGADIDAEKRVDDSLVQICGMMFGNKANFCSGLVKILTQPSGPFCLWQCYYVDSAPKLRIHHKRIIPSRFAQFFL